MSRIDTARLAAIWNEAMGRTDGADVVGHMAAALREIPRRHKPSPGEVQDLTLTTAFPDADSEDPIWFVVASNAVGDMLRDLRDQLAEAAEVTR